MCLRLSEPASVGQILAMSVRGYVAHWRRLLPLSLMLAAVLVATGLVSDLLLAFVNADGEPTPPDWPLPTLAALAALIAVSTVLSFVLYLAMVRRIDNIANQRPDSLAQVLATGVQKLPPMLAASLLYALVTALGLLLLLIPGVILSLSLAFYVYFIVIDGRGGHAALLASHRLVWGQWWRTAAVFALPGLALTLFYGGSFFITGLAAMASVPVLVLSLANALINLVSALAMPYFWLLGHLQLQDLRLRQQAPTDPTTH